MKWLQRKEKVSPLDGLTIPAHIGIIMDGNGRWARKRGLPRKAGHSAGAKTFMDICKYCNRIGVQYLTVYAFSTENWKRPQKEVDALMDLFKRYLGDASQYKDENVKTRIIGDRTPLDGEINTLIDNLEAESKDCTGLTLNIAVNYGGRDEIVHAARALVRQGLSPEQIDEQSLERCLYTAGQPDPDIILRPSGEKRLSNFMIWQAAYSEFIFMDVLWPDFTPAHIDEAIREYNHRNRRFGGV